ncbi:TetR/AcrR family transcriptional regulator C-terminal domain-containing protein [Nonomuraea sp. SYSU D8015]|uniref:TetR/AcrR family transcriptional regulator C-terminal domain-containing protein n=1 Tax=Nonomuraea sp. SYSU D8015 TaxID=2593644 RepID=UPI001660DA64|nr:TetR/AcrR family transcriptional regulator C-terminal domain-containing protein [Nonomuraea sp. SYSU D8015]
MVSTCLHTWFHIRLTDPRECFESFSGQIATYYRDCRSARLPHLHTYVDDLIAGDGEDRFHYGLELLLDGIGARMPTS